MPKPACRRSACDPCRAKRVRCLRPPDSLAPCARCRCVGVPCVTGAARRTGRPPKLRLAPSAADSTPAAAASPATATATTPHDHAEALALVLPAPPGSPPPPPPPSYFWPAPGDSAAAAFFGAPFAAQEPVLGDDLLFLADLLDDSPYPRSGGLRADEAASAAAPPLDVGTTSMALDTEIVHWFPGYEGGGGGGGGGGGSLPPVLRPPAGGFSAARALSAFREAMDRRIAAADAYYADPALVLQRCRGHCAGDGGDADGGGTDNPTALLLTCSAELLAIVQRLAPAADDDNDDDDDDNDNDDDDADGDAAGAPPPLGTETVLLALAGYLALLRLFDALFHRIHQQVCEAPPASFRALTVKAVLRVGGVAALQDMPLRAYAVGLLGAIQGQMHALERCMGIPAEHCLADHDDAAAAPAAAGLFARADRARLFWAVMAQEDVRPRRGRMSYAESIRASIKESMAFLEG